MTYRLTMILRRSSPNHAYTVRCKELPELIAEGRTIDDALDNAIDAFVSTLEIYDELNKELPAEIIVAASQTESLKFQTKTPDLKDNEPGFWFEATVPTPMLLPRNQSPLYDT